jgi:hypothetical protein
MSLARAKIEHTCSRCRTTKPITEFHVCDGKPHCYCKVCMREYNRERRSKWTPAQWAKHQKCKERWCANNHERRLELLRRNQRKRKPVPTLEGSVYRIPRGKLKGRLQINYFRHDGKRVRMLCRHGTSRAEAEKLLAELQAVHHPERYLRYKTRALVRRFRLEATP